MINAEDTSILRSTLVTSFKVLLADGRVAEADLLQDMINSFGGHHERPHERIDILKVLQDQLKTLVGQHELPNVRKCNEVFKDVENELQGFIGQHDSSDIRNRIEILKSLQEDHKKLEAVYFEKKAALIADFETLTDELRDKGFWLNLLKTDKLLAEEVGDLTNNSEGFRLEFYFNPMPDKPEHSLLTKTFHNEGTISKNAIGTNVEGPRRCPSFFNLFRDFEDENTAEEVQSKMKGDYDIGSRIRDKLIDWCKYLEEDSEEMFTASYWKRLQRRSSLCFKMYRMDKLIKRYHEKRDELEVEYQKIYEPLYAKRYHIVNGINAVDVETEVVADRGTKLGTSRGVPGFWLTAMKANKILAQEITTRDEGALKYLTDIKSCVEMAGDPKIFRLVFVFDPNPYFKNSKLQKTYHMIDCISATLENRYGTKIKWYPGKRLTEEVARMGSITNQLLAKTGEHRFPSFFNFFDPPEYSYAPYLNDRNALKVEHHLERDYYIGSIIRDEIIPHAVLWFHGDSEEFHGDSEEDEEIW